MKRESEESRIKKLTFSKRVAIGRNVRAARSNAEAFRLFTSIYFDLRALRRQHH